MIVPVYLSHQSNPTKEYLVYAMLDTQSDTTFLLENTYKQLQITGTEVQLRLSTLSSVDSLIESTRVKGLSVRGYNSNIKVPLPPTFTRDIMPADRSHIPTSDLANEWPHLCSISHQLSPLMDVPVALLIGYNCPQALLPREVIPHPDGGPYGQKTDLGWGIVGISHIQQNTDDLFGTSHRILASQTLCSTPYQRSCIVLRTAVTELKGPNIANPSQAILNALEYDFRESNTKTTANFSQDDVTFLNIVTAGIHRTSTGHYEMPLPIRPNAQERLPKNKHMALSRLSQLRRKLIRNKPFHTLYTNVMNDLLRHGYAEPTHSADEEESWYIPHHGVLNAKKPNKLRVVFDCSATFNGISLNSNLLQGPDLINNLVGILCRFRRDHIAIACDVEAMFHQFSVNPEHRNLLRFLWWENGDLNKLPTEYHMTVHLFGAVSSPACANFALQRLAEDYKDKYGKTTAQFISRDFYVDDGLTSLATEEEAIDLINNSQSMCKEGGLKLHKFLSNSKTVMSTISPQARAGDSSPTSIMLASPGPEKVLGVNWCVESDTIGFRIELCDKPPTRRGILSIVSSIYDPLGLVAPVLLLGKQILQDICKLNVDWDDSLPEECTLKWHKWRQEVIHLSQLQIPRCYKPSDFGTVVQTELHHFADASTKGYGACSYLRQIDLDGHVCCSLVMGKSRVTPSKIVSIPRLELSAAVTAAKLSHMLDTELDLPEIKHFFWSDSKVALSYISNDCSRFHIFVANRVQLIRNITNPDQWHHVPTDMNPADLASRGCSAQELVSNHFWFHGPPLLYKPVVPLREDYNISTDDPEVRSFATNTHKREDFASVVLDRLNTYSSWTKMLRVIATCLRFKERLMSVVNASVTNIDLKSPFKPDELSRAQILIIKLLQKETFLEEISKLKSSGEVKIKCDISKLNPFLDEKGILRVGGRIKNSSLPFELKHPVLLPKRHHITFAILHYFHDLTAHQGRSLTINAVRDHGFWAIGATKSVASIISQCVQCRKLRGRAQEQRMSDLPPDRLEEAPPFTNTGMDIFGPFVIKEGRKDVKRWACIYTCLASRAVHLEVVTSLSTDSFLNALRRFLNLRGTVRKLLSDQGTNFIGARNELDKAMSEIVDDKIRNFLAANNCEFVFNAPHASHMGGVWERLIHSARSILASLFNDCGKQLDDDSLRTLLTETASIMNSRPLTTENLNDPTSLPPITPNHLLTLKSSVVVPPPGSFQREDVYSRKRWRRVQYLANVFWSRWRKEYLHQLQQRQKWLRPKRNLVTGDIVLLIDENFVSTISLTSMSKIETVSGWLSR